MDDLIRVSISVPWAPADAFRRFVEDFGQWWPREYTWGGDALEAIGMEPRAGGLCTEHGPHGFRCDWGRVLTWAPPERLVLAWQISPRREPVPDPEQASLVEVRFAADGDGGTRVRLAHTAFGRHGAGAAGYRAALASPQGWPYILSRFAAA
jgi:uncharacterized protein YndB with AHSA1/START domain